MNDADTLMNEIEALFKSKKYVTKEVRDKVASLRQHIHANMPFIQTQFNRAMDKTVTEAKGEVESFIEGKIRSLGIDALETEIARALRTPLESEPLQLKDANR